MQHLLDSIKTSLSTKNWYSAIAISLMLPDICATVTDGTKSSGAKYSAWFDKYVAAKYTNNYDEQLLFAARKNGVPENDAIFKVTKFSGSDCYALRCAFLHEGSGAIINQRAREILDEVKFLEPNYAFNVHGSIQNNRLLLHTDEFCEHMLEGVQSWENQLDEVQKARLNDFLQIENIFDF